MPRKNCEGDVSDELLVTTDGAVRIVTINRPDDLNIVNAIPAALAVELGLANRITQPETLMEDALQLAGRLAARPARALQTTKRAFSKHLAQAAIAIIDYGLAAETLELGADDHIEKVREFLGADKYDAIPTPEA